MSMSTSAPAAPGKSLFESRTVWSILAAAFFAYLPSLLSSLGVSADQQGTVILALHQLGTPLALVASILFHAISTKPVTSVLPQKPPPAATVAILAVCLLGACFGSPLFFLSACASQPLVPPAAEVVILQGDATLDASYNVAARLYLAALPSMPATTHDKLKPLLLKAYQLVEAVDGGTVLSGETSVAQEISDASRLIAEVRAALQP